MDGDNVYDRTSYVLVDLTLRSDEDFTLNNLLFGRIVPKGKSYSYTYSFRHPSIHLFIHSSIWQELAETYLWIANMSGTLTRRICFDKEGSLWVPNVSLS